MRTVKSVKSLGKMTHTLGHCVVIQIHRFEWLEICLKAILLRFDLQMVTLTQCGLEGHYLIRIPAQRIQIVSLFNISVQHQEIKML